MKLGSFYRDIAQPGFSAPGLEPGGRRFESCCPDFSRIDLLPYKEDKPVAWATQRKRRREMANKTLFSSSRGPQTDMINEAGGTAYRFKNTHALAQLAATGCLSSTYYANAHEQLDKVLDLCKGVAPLFIAKTAIYARKRGYMKDMPALLCAYLSTVDPTLLRRVFPKVIDNAKMLRNFVQIMRSGAVGRKSLGSAPKKLIINWLNTQDDDNVFRASVGQDPSMADIIKMVHPTPENKKREALYGYMLKREYSKRNLPKIVKLYETFKSKDDIEEIPNVPFQMLTSFDLDVSIWKDIIKNAGWHMVRMNLNTFERHGVFNDSKMVQLVANKLRNEELIRKSRVFPYQLLMAYKAYHGQHQIEEALQDAMEIAVANVPKIEGKIAIFPDVSGSMHSAVTGYRKGATTNVRCVDIAALVASVFLRQNKDAIVLPFEGHAIEHLRLNSRDSIMSNAQKLASLGGGSTNCSAPLHVLNRDNAKVDLCIFVSDNESWIETATDRWIETATDRYYGYRQHGTATMDEWQKLKKRNPKAKLVCLDIQAYSSTQASDDANILNVGGFSDTVFDIIREFYNGNLSPEHWVGLIDQIEV
jgi:60 kDa SS-A/Ro ribonucleoprotein